MPKYREVSRIVDSNLIDLVDLPEMLGALAFAAVAVLATYLYTVVHHKRFRQFADFPQLAPSLIWGHLKVFDAYSKLGSKDEHPGALTRCSPVP